MTDDVKQQLFGLMAYAEEQQKAVDKALEVIDQQRADTEKLIKALPALAVELFKNELKGARNALEGDLSQHGTEVAERLKKASSEALRASDAVKNEAKTLGWKYAAMTVGAVLGSCLLIILGATLWIPSLEDIADRKATVERLNDAGGGLQTANCGGELCVRVMTKKCGFGDTKDYCVLDLK